MHERNMLLHSILDTIFKQIEQPWRLLQDDNWFDPLAILLEIKKWGITKGRSGQMEKTKKQFVYIAKKSPHEPSLSKKRNKRLNKKNDH